LLKGQRVVPRALLDEGFVFGYPTVDTAMTALL
jgi:NAD dependent epimerase/dehydratase family enzyme